MAKTISETTKRPSKVSLWLESVGVAIAQFFVNIGKGIVRLVKRIGHFFVNLWYILRHGNWKTRMSCIIMGFGCFMYGQWLRGSLYLLLEVGFILFMIFSGSYYLGKFGTLGTEKQGPIYNDQGLQIGTTEGDNSLIILLFGVVTIVLILLFAAMYIKQLKNAYNNQERAEFGLPIENTANDLRQMLNKNFHVTMLAAPTLGIACFTVIPLIFMILIAFTNYDKEHLTPAQLFTWVGFENFKNLFQFTGTTSMGKTFFSLLGWTLLWAVLSTVTTYIGGMVLAILINKKGVRFKKVFRGFFVVTIAVPQFVSLLVVAKFFSTEGGLVNQLLMSWGWIDKNIRWLEDVTLARAMVVIINMWIGIPYSMLITSGILMNIPEELYESARIDGAGPIIQFFKITLPYMLFVTGPYLLTQFIGNINNFNVIFLLTGGGPTSPSLMAPAGKTDLLITWLYDITVSGNYMDYKLGSTIGILVFIVCAVMSLAVYGRTSAVKNEEDFQ